MRYCKMGLGIFQPFICLPIITHIIVHVVKYHANAGLPSPFTHTASDQTLEVAGDSLEKRLTFAESKVTNM